jgi:hypothetical protein
MARKVDSLYVNFAEVPYVAIVKTFGIGAWRKVELGNDRLAEFLSVGPGELIGVEHV